MSQPQTYLYALIGLGCRRRHRPGHGARCASRCGSPCSAPSASLGALSFGALPPARAARATSARSCSSRSAGVAAVVPVIMLLGLWVEALRSRASLALRLPAVLRHRCGPAGRSAAPPPACSCRSSKLDLQGSQYELGQFNFVLLAGAAGRPRRRWCSGARSCGAGASPGAPARGLAVRRPHRRRAGRPARPHPRLHGAAPRRGQLPARPGEPRQVPQRRRASPATSLLLVVVRRLRRPGAALLRPGRARRSTATRGTARRSSGPPRRRRRPTRTSPSGSVRSPRRSPCSTGRRLAPARRWRPDARPAPRPVAGPAPHAARRPPRWCARPARCCSPACSACTSSLRDAAGGTTADVAAEGRRDPRRGRAT